MLPRQSVLASFAAAAVSGGKPIKTGLIAFGYSLRTAILPFMFIFNTDLLLIDVSVMKGFMVFIVACLAILAFTAASMRYFFDHNKVWETALLLIIAFALFRPGFFMGYISPTERYIEPVHITEQIAHAPIGEDMTLRVAGINQYGTPITFYTKLKVPAGDSGEERLHNLGLTLLDTGDKIEVNGEMIDKIIIDDAQLDSVAEKSGLSWDQTILEVMLPRHDALPKELTFIPALALLFGLAWVQIRRRKLKIVS